MKVKISADSTCDLSPELLARYNIGITPLYVVMDEKSYRDGVDITPDMVYDHVSAGGDLCSTAAVSVADYLDYFSAQLREYDAVVHFHISGEMSSCCQNACIAAAELGRVYPVDARNLSTGIGQLVLDAAELAREGVEAEEIQRRMNEKKEKLDVSFVLDTLEYLRRGGRCSTLAAMGANLLSLKPCIEVHEGKMGVGKKYRGHYEKCLLQYIRERLEGREDIDTHRIFITHSGQLPPELLEEARAEVLRCQSFEEVLFTRAGCTISCHCGPRCLGILYYHK